MSGHVLMILCCERYRFKAVAQRKTWLSGLPTWLTWMHVFGNPQMAEEYEHRPEEHSLYVRVQDDYNSLPQKTVAAMSAILRAFPDLRYLYKTDDDQMLLKPQLFETLPRILTGLGVHYGGNLQIVKNPYISQYSRLHPSLPRNLVVGAGKYCTGRFYVLSRPALESVVANRHKFAGEYLEDYAVGKYLADEFKTDAACRYMDTSAWFKDMEIGIP